MSSQLRILHQCTIAECSNKTIPMLCIKCLLATALNVLSRFAADIQAEMEIRSQRRAPVQQNHHFVGLFQRKGLIAYTPRTMLFSVV